MSPVRTPPAPTLALVLLSLLSGLLVSDTPRPFPPLPAAAAASLPLGGLAAAHDTSPPLRTLRPRPPTGPRRAVEHDPRRVPPVNATGAPDPVVQRAASAPGAVPAVPALDHNWPGLAAGGYSPPDPNGAVGPAHYLQVVNGAFQIWSKQGGALYGPAALSTLWTGFGGDCATRNDGDPVALYDRLADRFFLSQFTAVPPYADNLRGRRGRKMLLITGSPP